MDTIYSKKSAAKVLGISLETLNRYKKMKKISFHQIGSRIIFTENNLTAFLASCAIPAIEVPTDREKKEMSKANGGKS